MTNVLASKGGGAGGGLRGLGDVLASMSADAILICVYGGSVLVAVIVLVGLVKLSESEDY